MVGKRQKCRLIFVAPGSSGRNDGSITVPQGGIAAVVHNYKQTAFWRDNGCRIFSSAIDDTTTIKKLVYLLGRLPLFMLVLIRYRPIAISLHTSYGRSFYRKLTYLLLARILGVRAVLHIHPASFFDFFSKGSKTRRMMIKMGFSLSDRVIFLSEDQRRQFDTVLASDKSFVLTNPVDTKKYDVWDDEWQKSPKQILYLGWIIPGKGVYDLVDAIPQVLVKHPGATFVFAGNKQVEQLKVYIAERGLEKSAFVLGWVDGIDKIKLLRTSRALILPSYTEGVPNVILEAMASHLPIITTPVGGIPSVIQGAKTGLFIEPGNSDEIASALATLLGSDRQCAELANAAFIEVNKNYGVEVIGRQLSTIYRIYGIEPDRQQSAQA